MDSPEGQIERVPLSDNSAAVIIPNRVVTLPGDERRVLQEA